MRRPLLEVLQQARENGHTLISDGAMGTQLQSAGLEPGGCGDEWNVLHPDRVLAIQRRYADAGAHLIITNTFGSNRSILKQYDLEGRVAEICRAGARIAREAAGDDRWVLGDVGPCGGFLEPLGDVSERDLLASLHEQIGALLEGGVDAIILETMTALEELEAAVRVAKELGAPCVIASLAFDRVTSGYRTMMGVAPVQAAQRAVEAGADVIGANCGLGMDPVHFVGVGMAYGEACELPVMLQPNAGQPELVGTQAVYPIGPEEMGDLLWQLAAHAQVVGGCCGTTPEHIAAFSRKLQGGNSELRVQS